MKRAALPFFLLLVLCPPLEAQTPRFSLWADEGRSSWEVTAGDWETYSFYLFLEPGPDGAFGAEFKVMPSAELAHHLFIGAESNSFVSVCLGAPYASPGASCGFSSCQTQAVWIYRYSIIAAPPNEPGYISVGSHDETGFLGTAICIEPRPLVGAVAYNELDVNNYYCQLARPVLRSVEIVQADSIIAVFSPCPEPVFLISSDKFLLYSNIEPPETIGVITPRTGGCQIPLRLQGSLVPYTEYTLEALDLCGLGWYVCCGSSSIVFTWIPTATLLGSWTAGPESGGIRIAWRLSSIDDGIVFDVLRSDGGGFSRIGSLNADPGVLDYEYFDRDALPSGAYTYRVEYEAGADRRVLFETEAVEISPMPPALEPNHPNPFNPSTRIDFTLPAAGEVSLDVFDAAGRYVRSIERGIRPAGRHEASWDGLDDHGRAVPSGVYFARLKAGKTVLSRKMVLLR